MVDTDWREILSFSQRELMQADKDKLCENLSWMEADDIELNFTDLKALFRLSQDILKYKSEEVKNLMGELEKANRKISKMKHKDKPIESPGRTSDKVLETISHQEEVIKTNKKILQQLYSEIAELEERSKKKYQRNILDLEKDSDSSRDPLSEINATAQLENEIYQKNRHIRKLLADVKILEEVNVELKDKLTQLKEKLKEATNIIENLTEQLFSMNSERNQLKEALGKCEQMKGNLLAQIETLNNEMSAKDSSKENIQVEVKSKLQYLKNLLKSHKTEIDRLSTQNTELKEKLALISKPQMFQKNEKNDVQIKMKELEDKLIEASQEIEQSAKLIQILKTENKRLINIINESPDVSLHENKNESDDGKERNLIAKLRGKLKTAKINLQTTEELLATREKELAEKATQLQLVQTEEGLNILFNKLKNLKSQLKAKDDRVKKIVIEINILNQHIDQLQFENETLRQELHVPLEQKVPIQGTLKKYHDMEKSFQTITKKLRENENKLVTCQMDNRLKTREIIKLKKCLQNLGYDDKKINEFLLDDSDSDSLKVTDDSMKKISQGMQMTAEVAPIIQDTDLQALIEENEGLRVGLKEILDFLKDNSTTSSGILALKCPSLEAICHAMDARHAAGWYGPHMTTLMDLKAAVGGKDALLTALHESRKETFEIMKQLSIESKKSSELQQRLHEKESVEKAGEIVSKETSQMGNSENKVLNYSISDDEINTIDFNNKPQVQTIMAKRNLLYDDQIKNSLFYFQNKFKLLHDSLTSLTITSEDNINEWLVKEENYKAEIENLKANLQQNADDDTSTQSPGLLTTSDITKLQRKITYLEESFKRIRTQYENLKNEYSETKREFMVTTCNYETNIQSLMLCNIDLTDRIRNCVPAEIFWRQNDALNEFITKYRSTAEVLVNIDIEKNYISKRLQESKSSILDYIQNLPKDMSHKNNDEHVEKYIAKEELNQMITEISKKDSQIERFSKKNEEVQLALAKIIDSFMGSKSNGEENFCKQQIYELREENKMIKNLTKQLQNQLDVATLKLNENQMDKENTDIEINLLQHQILDLQSEGDNKAIIARLSCEILTSYLQISHYNKTILRLTREINKEKQIRADAEAMFKTQQEVLIYYISTYDYKFRNMFEIVQALRQEYQGSLPLCTIETYISNLEELRSKTFAANEKLDDIENLRLQLMIKHSVYNQILETASNQCLEIKNTCKHVLENKVQFEIQRQEIDLCNKKMQAIEQSRKKIIDRCNYLEQKLLLLNQDIHDLSAKDEANVNNIQKHTSSSSIDGDDIHSEDDASDSSKRNETFTLHESKFVRQSQTNFKNGTNPAAAITNENQTEIKYKPEFANVFTQTDFLNEKNKYTKIIQTDDDNRIKELLCHINKLDIDIKRKTEELTKVMKEIQHVTEKLTISNEHKVILESTIEHLTDAHTEKDNLIASLKSNIVTLRNQIDDFKSNQYTQILQENNTTREENRTLLLTLKELENEKNSVIIEYKDLLTREREDNAKTIKDLHAKLSMMQSQKDGKDTNATVTKEDVITEAIIKYVQKNTELEDKCFKLQSDLNGCKAEIASWQSEVGRWKDLASERLSKMEQLGAQLKERHNVEVESYKAENQHWLSQLNDTQREHLELRSRLTEQKAIYIKQLSDKDSHIEQLRTVVQNLKTQIMNMQTMLSINDPSFDLSAIVEVEEASDAISPQGSERLELKFDSVIDLDDFQDDYTKMPTTSTAIWQEPLIERLRREKQLIGKQNAILRRQIKAVAARERRARLDAQNLKNQVFRITTSGSKGAAVESAALQTKIASLQAQLTSARRDVHSNVAIWDKWKRAQQSAEKWQARYEEKCQDEKKLEASLTLTKSALTRLEKEKRVLLGRLSELKSETRSIAEKQDDERSEKGSRSQRELSPPPLSTRALLDRIQAQQRRIAALEVAEKGNEPLVSEYERALAEITSLKGQVLKLESTLLESQIRTPINTTSDTRPELEYWKSYCDMLKEENMQLTLRINSLETTPTSAHQQRINDLEQTILTLRGLVSKLQADQKSSTSTKRVDSRPSSGRSSAEKTRNQIDTYRTEISNLKRTIQEKDLLLEKSKEMLKIAAEREEELLKENMLLRRRFDELVERNSDFLSA